MSTDISVSVALEGLRRLSQGAVNANRQNKLQEDQRKAAAAEAVAAQQRGTGLDPGTNANGRDAKGRFLYGAKLRTSTRPEVVAAYRSEQAYTDYLATAYSLTQVFWDGLVTSTFTRTIKITPMDGVTTAEMSQVGYAGSGNNTSISGYDFFFNVSAGIYNYDIFPVGKETAVAVMVSRSAQASSKCVYYFGGPSPPPPGFTQISYSELPVGVEAIIFDRSSARRLTAPAALVSAYDAHIGNAIYTPGVQNPSYTITTSPHLTFSGYAATANGFEAYGLETGLSPSITDLPISSKLGSPTLQAFLTENPPKTSVTTYAQLNSFLQSSGVTPPTRTYSSCQLDGTCPDGIFNYDVIERVASDLDAYLGDETFSKAQLRSFGVPDLIPEVPGASENDRQILTAWDWGQPDYCRNKLLDLGFSEADLTP